MRRRFGAQQEEFPLLEDLRREGMTDYLALVNRFGSAGAIGMMDCTFSSWATDRPAGYAPADIAALEFLVPCLALAIKSASIARITETLVETYLGRDAGHRVLRGHIERGVAEKISAVLWFSEEDEANVWELPRLRDTLAARGVPMLVMARRDEASADGALTEIAAFLKGLQS